MTKLDFDQPLGPQVFNYLREAIITLKLLPGQRLSEVEIADSLKVSRMPVRKATARLSEVGLITVRPQRGSFVIKISEQAVLDACFMRETLETAVVKQLVENPSKMFFKLIERNLVEQENAAAEKDRNEFIKLDDYFHRSISEAVGRLHVWKVIEAEKAQMDRVRYLSYPIYPLMEEVVEQHRNIISAVKAGDIDELESKMRFHLSSIKISMASVINEYPEYFVN